MIEITVTVKSTSHQAGPIGHTATATVPNVNPRADMDTIRDTGRLLVEQAIASIERVGGDG